MLTLIVVWLCRMCVTVIMWWRRRRVTCRLISIRGGRCRRCFPVWNWLRRRIRRWRFVLICWRRLLILRRRPLRCRITSACRLVVRCRLILVRLVLTWWWRWWLIWMVCRIGVILTFVVIRVRRRCRKVCRWGLMFGLLGVSGLRVVSGLSRSLLSLRCCCGRGRICRCTGVCRMLLIIRMRMCRFGICRLCVVTC